MCIWGTNKDVDNYKQEFSIEYLLISIKKLKARVKQLEARHHVYEVPQTNTVNQNNEESKSGSNINLDIIKEEPEGFYEQHEVESINK